MRHLSESISKGVSTKKYHKWEKLSDFDLEVVQIINKAFDIMVHHKGFLLDVPKKTQYHVECFHNYTIGYWLSNLQNGKPTDYIDDLDGGGLKILHDCLVFSARETKKAEPAEIDTMKDIRLFLEDYLMQKRKKTFDQLTYTSK